MQKSLIGSPTAVSVHSDLTAREFLLFRDLISAKTGISLRDTKCPMLSARLHRRLRALNLASFEAYHQFLVTQDPAGEERRELINCITTNKTSFFRELHHFDFIAKLFQESVVSSPSPRPFNIWSAACSTGEEPYSMAMTLRDVLDRSPANRDFNVLATDIDTQVLQFARSSIYSEGDLEPVPSAFHQRFFLRGSGSQAGRYRVKPELREQVNFRQLNLIDPNWDISGTFDAIFCRNALIYFEHETQNRILRRLIGFLKPRGHLIVGHSEHLHWMADVLEPVGTTAYRVKNGG
jgi:chemotaxis protein methyltransferase CheR